MFLLHACACVSVCVSVWLHGLDEQLASRDVVDPCAGFRGVAQCLVRGGCDAEHEGGMALDVRSLMRLSQSWDIESRHHQCHHCPTGCLALLCICIRPSHPIWPAMSVPCICIGGTTCLMTACLQSSHPHIRWLACSCPTHTVDGLPALVPPRPCPHLSHPPTRQLACIHPMRKQRPCLHLITLLKFLTNTALHLCFSDASCRM